MAQLTIQKKRASKKPFRVVIEGERYTIRPRGTLSVKVSNDFDTNTLSNKVNLVKFIKT